MFAEDENWNSNVDEIVNDGNFDDETDINDWDGKDDDDDDDDYNYDDKKLDTIYSFYDRYIHFMITCVNYVDCLSPFPNTSQLTPINCHLLTYGDHFSSHWDL